MTSSKSRGLISGKGLGDDLVTWEAPEVSQPTSKDQQDPEAELAALREQCKTQGFAAGHAAGLAAAQAEITAQREALATTLNALSRPFDELEQQVEEELLALVQAVAQQLVRRELKSDPGEVVGLVRAALTALPASSRDVVVRLHPDDAQLVKDLLKPDANQTPWSIQADPLLERGNCQVNSDSSQIDGRLETRLGRTIATMFEEQRADHEQT